MFLVRKSESESKIVENQHNNSLTLLTGISSLIFEFPLGRNNLSSSAFSPMNKSNFTSSIQKASRLLKRFSPWTDNSLTLFFRYHSSIKTLSVVVRILKITANCSYTSQVS